MKTSELKRTSESTEIDEAWGYSIVSADLRVDRDTRAIYVRKHVHRSDEDPWLDLKIQYAWSPPCPITPNPTRLVDHDQIYWTLVAALDTYILRQQGSKSHHDIVSDTCRTLVKAFEYTWSLGFYDPQDVPEAIWQQLRSDLVAGSWPYALQVEERAVSFLAGYKDQVSDFVISAHSSQGKFSLRRSFTDCLGTNICQRELNSIKCLVEQASADTTLQRSGDLKKYKRLSPTQMSRTMLQSTLRTIDLLAQLPPEHCVRTLPVESGYDYARKHGRPSGRTENIDPETWAKLLTHAYHWIFDLGHHVVELVRAAVLHLEPYYDGEMRQRAMEDPSVGTYRSQLIRRLLPKLDEAKQLGERLGLKITNFVRKRNALGETSLYAILGQLYSSCFVVLASMNGRRRDEISGRSVGLHMGSLRRLEGELNLYECEFYIEKTAKDYVPHLVNDVSRRAIEIVRDIAEMAWRWSGLVNPDKQKCEGREEKIFLYPAFTGAKGVPLWFDFNANATGASESFVADALGSDSHKFRVSAHMFRRAYGLLYHYRYENALLIALTQKYGHIDTASTLHYVTNSSTTEFGKTAAAKWSAPNEVISRARQEQREDLISSIDEIGREKLITYVQDVIKGSRNFSGGFSKLVARYHRMWKGRLSYRALDEQQQCSQLSKALISRGHAPYPYPGNTCMAGQARKHAACSRSGQLERERASPAVCGRCPYSDTNAVQLAELERDESVLSKISCSPKTVSDYSQERNLDNLRRVIRLHKQRLEATV